MKICRASTRWPASPAAACSGAIPSARSMPELLRLLCACALSAPSKSDLQQADIVIVNKADQAAIADLIPDQPFIRTRRRSWCFWRTAGGCRKSRRCAASRSRTIISTSSSTPRSMPGSCWPPSLPRRRGRARHLPDQRDPRSFGESERDAEAAAAGHPGRRMCVGWPSDAGHISARLGSHSTLHEGHTTKAISPRGSTPMITAAPRSIRTSRGSGALGRRAVLRLVGGQGAAIRRAAARGFRGVCARKGDSIGLAVFTYFCTRQFSVRRRTVRRAG